MKGELPREYQGSLDFAGLVRTLDVLEGEEVVCWLSIGDRARIQIRGALRSYDYGGWGKGFAVGCEGRVLLVEDDFRGAELGTGDGNEHFTISVRSGEAEFLIGSPALHESDEFDLFP